MSADPLPEGQPHDPAQPPDDATRTGAPDDASAPETQADIDDALTQLARQLFADSGSVPEWVQGRGQPGRPPARDEGRLRRTSSDESQDG
ncbi:MAG: hypothetical protein J0H69_10480 [Burkholderiales bacterium]|jgi:hypothetical protein|nr:hypothetical protein [Burkholderiales bacterium]